VYNPIAGDTIHRKFRHGKHLELFLLDERSFRDPNPDNYDSSGIEMLGQQQFEWLKQSLKRSRATWKLISTHDPLSIATGGVTDRDAWGQGDARVLGREVQLGELLKFIKDEGIKNVVFITADVHFAAAISYDPARAQFGDFDPSALPPPERCHGARGFSLPYPTGFSLTFHGRFIQCHTDITQMSYPWLILSTDTSGKEVIA
jgi:alkaline phosphatase D